MARKMNKKKTKKTSAKKSRASSQMKKFVAFFQDRKE